MKLSTAYSQIFNYFSKTGKPCPVVTFFSARHFIWLWVLCNLRQHDWCSTFMRGILTAPLQRSMRTQLCVRAGNLEFMSPWQQNPRSCIMDYHWNSTPLPNIMRAQDLIKSAHSVWHKVKKELSLYWSWSSGKAARQAGKRAGGRAAGRLGCDGPSSCRACSLIDGSHIHQWAYRQMALNAWNFQPRKQLFSLTSAVRLTLLSWNIEQRRRMRMVSWWGACWSQVGL